MPGAGSGCVCLTVSHAFPSVAVCPAAIESFMADAGRKSLQQFLAAVQEYAQVGAAAPGRPLGQACAA